MSGSAVGLMSGSDMCCLLSDRPPPAHPSGSRDSSRMKFDWANIPRLGLGYMGDEPRRVCGLLRTRAPARGARRRMGSVSSSPLSSLDLGGGMLAITQDAMQTRHVRLWLAPGGAAPHDELGHERFGQFRLALPFDHLDQVP